MAVYLRAISHDDLFNRLNSTPVIINDIDVRDQRQLKKLNDLMITTYTQDTLELIPRCECKTVKGDYNVGLRCPVCGELCLPLTERPLESILWFRTPTQVLTLINPVIWILLSKKFSESGINVLEWLTNPMMRVPVENQPIERLKAEGVRRGLNHFYENFDAIVDLLLNGRIFTSKNKKTREVTYAFIQEYRHAIFSKHIPFPSKLLFICEASPMGVYRDKTIDPGIEAVRTISSIEHSVRPLNIRSRESKTVRAIDQLANYYHTFFKESLGGKPGWYRKHVYGGRPHFSFRAVAVSITEPHHREDVHLPWTLSLLVYSLDIKSKLIKRPYNYTPIQAARVIHEAAVSGSPLIERVLQELLDDHPNNRLPILLNRNPSLTRGSIQRLWVSKFKTDPTDNTIALSVLILNAFNCDFDGDQLNGILIHDHQMTERLSRLQPHHYAIDLNTPRKLSGFIKLPSPVISNLAEWIEEGETCG